MVCVVETYRCIQYLDAHKLGGRERGLMMEGATGVCFQGPVSDPRLIDHV